MDLLKDLQIAEKEIIHNIRTSFQYIENSITGLLKKEEWSLLFSNGDYLLFQDIECIEKYSSVMFDIILTENYADSSKGVHFFFRMSSKCSHFTDNVTVLDKKFYGVNTTCVDETKCGFPCKLIVLNNYYKFDLDFVKKATEFISFYEFILHHLSTHLKEKISKKKNAYEDTLKKIKQLNTSIDSFLKKRTNN